MPSANVLQVLMYAIACQYVLGQGRGYSVCQHVLREFYIVLGHANMCLGVLVKVRCSR